MVSRNANQPLYREVTAAALLGLVVNLVLGAVKLVGGLVSGSYALVADAVNSWGDVFVSIVVLIALRVAQRPADAEHPYGHSRAEAIAASNVALLIILLALFVGWEAVSRLGQAHEMPPAWTFWIAGVNVIVKEALYQYKSRIGKRTGSQAIVANAWDHRSDALCSLAVLVGLAAVRWGGSSYLWADEVAALVVVAAIVATGVALFRRSANELLDAQAAGGLVRKIQVVAISVAGVKDVETLRVRKSGLEYFVDIHIEVDPNLTVAEGHRISHHVKDQLLERFPELRDVLVHLEPHPHSSAACDEPPTGQ